MPDDTSEVDERVDSETPLGDDAVETTGPAESASADAETGSDILGGGDCRAHWVQQPSEVAELARQILDPARARLIVCVTKQPSLELPLVDPEALAVTLGDRADVWVITESDDAWALTEALPDRIDVYGGAVRAWVPIADAGRVFPSDHPQWTVFTPEDAARIPEQVAAFAALADDPPPPFGAEATATVTGVRKAGAELLLDTGHEAFAASGHLIQHGAVYHAAEIVRVGQEVRVRVGPWHAQAAKVSVSLRDFAPDPWQRLADEHAVGDVVDGIVGRLLPYGAFIELLPGVEGLLHISRISDEYIQHVDDHLQSGDRVAVALLSLDPQEQKAEVSIVDVPRGAKPSAPMSVYPGGPPWLPSEPGAFGDDDASTDGSSGIADDSAAGTAMSEDAGEHVATTPQVEQDGKASGRIDRYVDANTHVAQFTAAADALVAASERLLPGDDRALRLVGQLRTTVHELETLVSVSAAD